MEAVIERSDGMPMEEEIGCGNEVPIEAETVDL